LGTHFYPKTRKKKRKHAQFMDYSRVVGDWGFSPSLYYVYHVDDLGAWYACQPDRNFFGNIEVGGEYFRPVISLPFYNGGNGDVVYGYVGVIHHRNMSIHEGRFVFVKNPMNIGQELSYVLGIKREINLQKYKKFELWKTK
jgi:hypothetical protein